MIQVTIIGSGNVGEHLLKVFLQTSNVIVNQVFTRKKESILHLIDANKIVSNFEQLTEADIFIVAVSDNAIAEATSKIPFKDKLVVHTSGSVAMNVIDVKHKKGVFYPLQTFSKSKEVDFSQIPICIEAENNSDLELLETLAKSISDKVFEINSKQRKALHVSAVFVCNFVNHLYQIGSEICQEHQVPFEVLLPLIEETANKIKTLSPQEAQTGPAKRNDTTTINAHLNLLTNENQKEIYKLLTKSIIDNEQKL